MLGWNIHLVWTGCCEYNQSKMYMKQIIKVSTAHCTQTGTFVLAKARTSHYLDHVIERFVINIPKFTPDVEQINFTPWDNNPDKSSVVCASTLGRSKNQWEFIYFFKERARAGSEGTFPHIAISKIFWKGGNKLYQPEVECFCLQWYLVEWELHDLFC